MKPPKKEPKKEFKKEPPSQDVVAPAPAVRAGFLRVRLCGRDYTTLAWFHGKYMGETQRNRVATKFGHRAVEFRNGDHKSLNGKGFAKAARPKELSPGRSNLSSAWLETECGELQVRRWQGGRNVMWLVDDLEAHCGQS